MKTFINGIAALALLLLSFNSIAGAKFSYPVSIGANTIWGAFGSARNSADPDQLIGVYDYTTSVMIYARDDAGNSASCTTNNVDHIAQLRGLIDATLIYVTWDSQGNCSQIYTYKASFIEPPLP